MVQEVVITYETLFELLKREKERIELQKLEPTFFSDTISYIKEKKKILEAKSDDSVFAGDERKKTEKQLENIFRILKELYERREKKIVTIALDKSRLKSNLIDTSSLLKEEKVLFDALNNIFNTYREAILFSVLNEEEPFMRPIEHRQMETQKPQETHQAPKKNTKLVRFTHKVPKFVGPELEEYGPFEEEDIANLPVEIAEVLLSKGKVEEINEDE
ncbi:MAG TPA: hypothetical protein VI564_07685 [Candidatus Nanoarchaeia archaeon]|nr:hypothetical protein [Candidatus Nanoarchaeia archaeon]